MAPLIVGRNNRTGQRLVAAGVLAACMAVAVGAVGAGIAAANTPTNGNTGNTSNSVANSGNANTSTNGSTSQGNSSGTTGGNGTTGTGGSTATTTSGQHGNTSTGNGSSGSSGGQGGTSGQTGGSTTSTSPPPPVVATLTGTGDGVLVHRYNGTVVQGYVGQPLRLHEVVEVTGSPGQASNANPATIDWLAGGTSDIYDAKPQQFVPGQGFAGRVHTQIDVNSGSAGGGATVLSGFMRFFFPPTATKHYKFEASTGTVTTSVKGTDFTVGYDPDTKTSAVFVTQDSVDVTPTNTSLKPLTLSAGNQVEVTANQVGPVTRLSGAGSPTPTTQAAKSSSGSSSLGMIVGVIVGVLVLAGLWWLLFVYLPRRRREQAAELAAASTAPGGVPPATGATADRASSSTEELPATHASSTPTQTMGTAPSWSATHRAPEGGMACWAAPHLDSPLVATLDPGLEVQVLEHESKWAHIMCSNGWSAWVDGRLLVGDGDGQGKERA